MTKALELPAQDHLKLMFDYRPETGELFWKARSPDMFPDTVGRSKEHSCAQWNSRWAGKPALSKAWNGYVGGSLNYKYVSAHRVIWKLVTGSDAEVVDHINGVKHDNRFENLRSVSYSENNRNRRVNKNSTSGTLGVHFAKRTGKWTAYITIGSFDTKEEAIAARKAAQDFLDYHENHGLPAH